MKIWFLLTSLLLFLLLVPLVLIILSTDYFILIYWHFFIIFGLEPNLQHLWGLSVLLLLFDYYNYEWKVKVLVAQSCPTLCDPMDYSLPGSSVRGICQAPILKWIVISFSKGSSWPRNWTWVLCIAGTLFRVWAIPSAKDVSGLLVSLSLSDQDCLLIGFQGNQSKWCLPRK